MFLKVTLVTPTAEAIRMLLWSFLAFPNPSQTIEKQRKPLQNRWGNNEFPMILQCAINWPLVFIAFQRSYKGIHISMVLQSFSLLLLFPLPRQWLHHGFNCRSNGSAMAFIAFSMVLRWFSNGGAPLPSMIFPSWGMAFPGGQNVFTIRLGVLQIKAVPALS